MRQQRSGATAWRSKTGTSVLLSSFRAISIGCPMAAPMPCIAAWISMLYSRKPEARDRSGVGSPWRAHQYDQSASHPRS